MSLIDSHPLPLLQLSQLNEMDHETHLIPHQWVQLQTNEPRTLFFMARLHNHCILGPTEIKILYPIRKIFVCLIWFLMSQSTIFRLCGDRFSWVEPVLSKDKCVLLKDTTQWCRWDSNPHPLGLERSTLPLSHCATWKIWAQNAGCLGKKKIAGLTRPRGYKTWVQSQTQNKAQWLANYCALFWVWEWTQIL